MHGKDDFRVELGGTGDGGIDVVDREPEQDAVALGSIRRIADPAVVMIDVEVEKMHHEDAVVHEPLVLGATAGALAAQEPLVPAAARLDIRDGDQRLRSISEKILRLVPAPPARIPELSGA